jgi:hypothetical protein
MRIDFSIRTDGMPSKINLVASSTDELAAAGNLIARSAPELTRVREALRGLNAAVRSADNETSFEGI